jgi:hypothetical protein
MGLDELEERERGLPIAVEQREQSVQHLRLARLVAFPARRGSLAHDAVDLQRELAQLRHAVHMALGDTPLSGPERQDSRQVVVDDDRLALAVQRSRHAGLGLLLGEPPDQRLGFAQELLVRRRVLPALLDQIVEQLRHLVVEARIGELVADDRLADVVNDPFGDGVARELAFSLS